MALRMLWDEVFGLERRRRDRRPCIISVVTHLSEDRLHQLHGLCAALTSDYQSNSPDQALVTTCIAILVEDRRGSARAHGAVRALPGIGKTQILRVRCFARAPRKGIGFHSTTKSSLQPSWYPINQLRNKALALAKTDLVLICDVDFRPCQRFARLARSAGGTEALLKRASGRLNCLVVPAFEVPEQSCEGDSGGPTSTISDGACRTSAKMAANQVYKAVEGPEESFWTKTLASKMGLLQQWDKGLVIPFASQVWPQGHRATNFGRWKGAHGPYEVMYEEGFEPFVIMNRLLVPPFDERFEGYGRNKVIFFYRLHALGFSFTVEPDLFLVHAPHAHSDSWRRTFGPCATAVSSPPPTGGPSERFAWILDQYRVAKEEANEEALERRQPRRGRGHDGKTKGFLFGLSNKKRLGYWSSEGAAKLAEYDGSFGAVACSDISKESMRHALLSSMHALWYRYHPKGVNIIARLESRLDRGDSDITIFTQCSSSRLSRLERMCDLWTGVISAAVIAEGGGRIDWKTRRQVTALHARVESRGKCRLDICLCQHAPGMAADDGLFPVNALRNAALGAARTDLVLSLDVDAMPMRDLHKMVSSPPTYKRLLDLCRGGESPVKQPDTAFAIEDSATAGEWLAARRSPPTFVVIPALEFADAVSPDDPRIEALLQSTSGGKQKASDLVTSGALRSFHARIFPEGHRQTNLDLWASSSESGAPYEVKYSAGYEPYGIFFRRHSPPFDERFRGFGLDKVSHCWHLHRMGWAFRALPSAFLIDLPHPPTEHRKSYQATPLFRASVDGLFQRFTNETNVSVTTAVTAAPSSLSCSSTAASNRAGNCHGDGSTSRRVQNHNHLVDDARPRDYEALRNLSLEAWGDAWIDAGARCRPDSRAGTKIECCGGGWDLKGSPSAWAGLRAVIRGDNSDSGGKGDEEAVRQGRQGEPAGGSGAGASAYLGNNDKIARPLRMVGGWVYVCTGAQEPGGGEGTGDFGLCGRSVLRPNTEQGVMRYWVHPQWDPDLSPRGKLPGLGMSGDVRFFVRWHSGSVGFCSLTVLGRPLEDVCEVHVMRRVPFSLDRDRTTALQLEADMRRTPDNGGALSFRAWADGIVVYEARVYASDPTVSGVWSGMWVEDALLHVLAAAAHAKSDKEIFKGGRTATTVADTTQYVLLGGVEVWGKRSTCETETKEAEEAEEAEEAKEEEEEEGEETNPTGDVLCPGNIADTSSMTDSLRFVFVASTGRCGTHFLSKLLSTAPDVLAVHEGAPKLSGSETLLAAAVSAEESYGQRRRKVTRILRSAQRFWWQQRFSRRQGAQEEVDARPLVYVETSHLFLKTFADVVMRELAPKFRVDVIVLRRDPAAVLKSRIELGHFCGRYKQSDWLFLPLHRDFDDPTTNATAVSWSCEDDGKEPAVNGEVVMDGFEALIEYAAYTEASIRRFRNCYEKKMHERIPPGDDRDNFIAAARQKRKDLPRPPPAAEPPSSSSAAPSDISTPMTAPVTSCNVVETSLESLQNESGVRKLFAELNIDVSEESTWRVVETGATNTRDGEKRRTVPLEYCRQRIISSPHTLPGT